MMENLISCVITTYNRDKNYLFRSLKSILNQTYGNTEIILVDDNPKDCIYSKHIVGVIKELNISERVILIKHDENLGAQKARNHALKRATGDFIAFLDDDDEWLPDKLELQLKQFEQSKVENVGLVYCGRYNIKSCPSGEIKKREENIQSPYGNIKQKLIWSNFIGSMSFPLVKKEVFDKVGFFDEELIAKQDYDMWMRVIKEYGVDYICKPLCNYYSHSEERITTNANKKLLAESKFFKKHYEDISQDYKAMSRKYTFIAKYNFILGNYLKSRRVFFRTIKLNPYLYKNYIWIILTYLKYRPRRIRVKYD